jgi:DNA-directed RNA polymerase subunit RPC12/RpoP
MMHKRRNKTKLIAKAEEGHKLQNEPIIESKGENNIVIDQEIECPRCHDMMTLCSDFDRFSYVCEECDFLLSMN